MLMEHIEVECGAISCRIVLRSPLRVPVEGVGIQCECHDSNGLPKRNPEHLAPAGKKGLREHGHPAREGEGAR